MKVKCLIRKTEFEGDAKFFPDNEDELHPSGWYNIKNTQRKESCAFHSDNKTVVILDKSPKAPKKD